MPEPVYINNTQFAALCGVSIPAFSNWKTRFPEFIPDYDLVIGKMGFWKESTALKWIAAHSITVRQIQLPS